MPAAAARGTRGAAAKVTGDPQASLAVFPAQGSQRSAVLSGWRVPF